MEVLAKAIVVILVVVKNLPAMQETGVQSLGQEYPLKKEMATHFSILAWEIQWREEPGSLQSMGLPRIEHDWVTKQQQHKVQKEYDCFWPLLLRNPLYILLLNIS